MSTLSTYNLADIWEVVSDRIPDRIAIDIESGRYAIDRDDYTAMDKLLRQVPEAQMWLVRVGHKGAYRIGGRAIRGGEG